ncbi:MAG: hypothetical protein FJ297_08550 [Planctomycetes bacterium]|nr:hypothetical protein [Planctomycetota bacterium]
MAAYANDNGNATMGKRERRPRVNKRRLQSVRAAIEISRSELRLVIVDNENGQTAVRAHELTWRIDSGPLHSDAGIRELTAGLKSLVARERLNGAAVDVALSGDFCVTRVVAGPNDEVRDELRALEERSSHYLLLGTGENRLAACSKTLDAKHQQAWVTVANTRTLNAVLKATENAGIYVRALEHSLVSLARAVGALEQDRELPVLLLEIGQRGVDIGISHQGQLLIDYRPGGISAKEQIAHIVLRHFERLQRFCRRRFRFAGGDVSRIFICGEADDVALVRRQFESQDQIRADAIVPQDVLARCELPDAPELNATYSSCIGLLVNTRPGVDASAAPNLMGDLVSRVKTPLWPAVAKVGWPVAAAVLVTIGIAGAGLHQRFQCAGVERQLAEFEGATARLGGLRAAMAVTTQKSTNLASIATQLRPAHWNELIVSIGTSLPKGVWLEQLSVEPDGTTKLSGPSHSEDGIFEFVKALKQKRLLSEVALEGTQPIQFNNEPATRFDITCRLAEPAPRPSAAK